MKNFIAEPVDRVEGLIRVPGDKSISHRALLFGALADGTTEVSGFLPGDDCLATLAALEAMKVDIHQSGPTQLRIEGVGLHGLQNPGAPLDMGNSGTAMRLLAGLMSAQTFNCVLTGDASLSRRPMQRVAEPLRAMGAKIETNDGHPPLTITGGQDLHGIEYRMPVASAQVKSAILLAGLYAPGGTTVIEPAVSRDHTERMLNAFGWTIAKSEDAVTLVSGGRLKGTRVDVPGDLSSAAFFLLAGCLAPAGEVVIEHVGLNPTRTGILRVLELMGADLEIQQLPVEHSEPIGRIVARPSRLTGIKIPREYVTLAIDEFPIIFIAAAFADGETLISGAEELRHKESDRIHVMTEGLKALGIDARETPDGARILGGRLAGGRVDSAGDHRVAMAFAAGAVSAGGPVHIRDTQNVNTSFPGFAENARSLGLNIVETSDDNRD
jgi:3-phosphoshikimate 1-carboxyvinyltransferase